MNQLTLFVILSFSVHRVTRFLMKDTLIERQRHWVLRQIAKPRPTAGGMYELAPWRQKLLDLTQCWWCLSIWVAGATTLVANQFYPLPLPWIYFTALSTGALIISDIVKGS